jgi:hypothetical protein
MNRRKEGFFAAGNAANGDFVAGLGDPIYTAGETTPAGVVPVRGVSWGGLKRRADGHP